MHRNEITHHRHRMKLRRKKYIQLQHGRTVLSCFTRKGRRSYPEVAHITVTKKLGQHGSTRGRDRHRWTHADVCS